MSVQTENSGENQRDERAEAVELGRQLGFFEGKRMEETPAATPVEKEPAESVAADTATGKPAVETEKPVTEPFKGFRDLPPESQEYIKNLQTREQESTTNYTRMLNRIPAMQREVENLRKQTAQPVSEQRTQDVAKSLKKFEEYKARFPEDAEAVQELLDSIKDEVKPSKELPDKVAQLEKRLDQREQQEATQRAAAQTTARLRQDHPDIDVIAGWKDDQGNSVPPEKQKLHPWFSAWLQDQPPEIQADYDAKLRGFNPVLIGHIITQFKRAAQSAMDANPQADAPNDKTPVAQRRAEALQDPSPRPSRGGAERTSNPFATDTSDSGRREAVAAYFSDFRAGKLQT